MFSFTCAWIYGWKSNRKAVDFRRHRAHHEATVMKIQNGFQLQPPIVDTISVWFALLTITKQLAPLWSHQNAKCLILVWVVVRNVDVNRWVTSFSHYQYHHHIWHVTKESWCFSLSFSDANREKDQDNVKIGSLKMAKRTSVGILVTQLLIVIDS